MSDTIAYQTLVFRRLLFKACKSGADCSFRPIKRILLTILRSVQVRNNCSGPLSIWLTPDKSQTSTANFTIPLQFKRPHALGISSAATLSVGRFALPHWSPRLRWWRGNSYDSSKHTLTQNSTLQHDGGGGDDWLLECGCFLERHPELLRRYASRISDDWFGLSYYWATIELLSSTVCSEWKVSHCSCMGHIQRTCSLKFQNVIYFTNNIYVKSKIIQHIIKQNMFKYKHCLIY